MSDDEEAGRFGVGFALWLILGIVSLPIYTIYYHITNGPVPLTNEEGSGPELAAFLGLLILALVTIIVAIWLMGALWKDVLPAISRRARGWF